MAPCRVRLCSWKAKIPVVAPAPAAVIKTIFKLPCLVFNHGINLKLVRIPVVDWPIFSIRCCHVLEQLTEYKTFQKVTVTPSTPGSHKTPE